MFDCVMPTRIARHGTIFTRTGTVTVRNAPTPGTSPLWTPSATATPAGGFTRAYVRHLLKAREILGMRLTTYHNLAFLIRLVEEARERARRRGFRTPGERRRSGGSEDEE